MAAVAATPARTAASAADLSAQSGTGAAQHLACMFTGLARDLDATQHPREFLDPLILPESGDGRATHPAIRQLADSQLVVCLARDLCQMRHAQHLPAVPEIAQIAADDFRDTAADPGIHFVEDHAGFGLPMGGGDLHRQADARQFSAGGDPGHGFYRQAGIGADQEFQPIDAILGRVGLGVLLD